MWFCRPRFGQKRCGNQTRQRAPPKSSTRSVKWPKRQASAVAAALCPAPRISAPPLPQPLIGELLATVCLLWPRVGGQSARCSAGKSPRIGFQIPAASRPRMPVLRDLCHQLFAPRKTALCLRRLRIKGVTSRYLFDPRRADCSSAISSVGARHGGLPAGLKGCTPAMFAPSSAIVKSPRPPCLRLQRDCSARAYLQFGFHTSQITVAPPKTLPRTLRLRKPKISSRAHRQEGRLILALASSRISAPCGCRA